MWDRDSRYQPFLHEPLIYAEAIFQSCPAARAGRPMEGTREMIASKLIALGWTRLPREVRETLGLGPGDTVRYVLRGEEVVMIRKPASAMDRLMSRMRDGGNPTGEDIEDATMEAWEAEFRREQEGEPPSR